MSLRYYIVNCWHKYLATFLTSFSGCGPFVTISLHFDHKIQRLRLLKTKSSQIKEKLNQVMIENSGHLDWHLKEFRFWYSHVRTHMNLDGRTPNEVWLGKGIKRHAEFYEAWGGLRELILK